MHSAKATLPSAKPLPSAALGKEPPVKKSIGKEFFAECLLSGIRQILCRVPDTRQILCRVPDTRQSWKRKKTRKMGKNRKKMDFF
jgi:hypothetical protein